MSDELPALLRVVRGEPRAEELAALVAVLTARPATRPTTGEPTSAWTERGHLVRRCPPPAPGAWRTSGWRF